MLSKLKTAYSVYKDDGIKSLLSTMRWRISTGISRTYYRLKGKQSFTIGGVSTEFHTQNREALNTIRWMFFCAEHELLKEVVFSLEEDDIFFDIGANIGLYSAFASEILKQGQVIAFEPYPPNVHELKLNTKEENTTVHEIAISDNVGTALFEVPEKKTGQQKGKLTEQSTRETFEVETDSIDRLVAEGSVPEPTVVKIDVEGAEDRVLNGMKRTLTSDSCREIYVEVHSRENNYDKSEYRSSLEEIRSILKSSGFKLTIKQRGDNHHIVAKKS